ncbi:MAG: ATP-binding protein [Candidatus Omnitrophota bacterium]
MSLYAGLSFWTSALSIILGSFVFLKNRRGAVNRTFGLLSLSIAFWSLGLGLFLSSLTRGQALFWGRMSHVGAILIAPSFVHFAFALLYLDRKKRKALIPLYLFSIALLSVSFSSHFIYDALPKLSLRYYYVPGILYHFFTLFFLICVVYAIWWMFSIYRQVSGFRRNQLKYALLASIIGFSGGATTFLLVYDIPVYPFGMSFMFFYAILTTYAITKYNLMNINLVARGWSIFICYLTMFSMFIIVLLPYVKNHIVLLNSFIIASIAIAPLFYRYLLKHLLPVLDKSIFKNTVGYLDDLRRLFGENREQFTTSQVASTLVRGIAKVMGLDSASLLLYNKYRSVYTPHAEVGLGEVITLEPFGSPSVPDNSNFIKRLKGVKEPIVRDEIRHHLSSKEYDDITTAMDKFCAEISFPVFAGEGLVGVLNLGKKPKGEMYHHQDIESIKEILEAASTHLSHTRFMENRASFSRKLSHDMKNLFQRGINTAMGNLIRAKDEETRNKSLNELNRQLAFLEKTLYDNFDLVSILERVVRNSFEVRPLHIKPVILSSCGLYKAPCDELGLYIKTEIPDSLPKVLINEEDMTKVFNNLFDNALKFTREGGIAIKAEQKDKDVLIEFLDTGCGIDKDEIEDIFEPKTNRPDNMHEGTGLGLVIVKDVIKAHKGKIWVESEQGRGATFYFTLPSAPKEVK